MRAALLLAFLAALVVATLAARPKWHELEGYTFEKFTRDFGRRYAVGSEEWTMRKAVFERRLRSIQEHNANPSVSWRRGVNLFSDLTDAEWKAYNRAYKSPQRPAPHHVHANPSDAPVPKTIDYRTYTSPRVLTEIKHQGSCGSCWAFSATEAFESYYALLTGMLPVLSPQQITACTPLCGGCDGGDAVLAYMYIESVYHGLTEEWAYPYTDFYSMGNTSACVNITQQFPNKQPYTWFAELNRVGCTGYVSVLPNNASATMHALATVGPLSISVAAGNWQDYETGVMQNNASNGQDNEWGIDHAVQMVGYGYDGDLGMNYWIVRNSWSTLWGEAGYVRLYRPDVEPCSPDGSVCGTSGCLSDPHFPLVKENTPQPF